MAENENISEILQQTESLGEKMAQAYDSGYLNSLQKTNTKVVQAFKTRYEAIGYQLKYGLITEQQYYDKLASIRDMYFSRNSQEWHKYTAEIYDYKVGELEKYKEAVEKNLTEVMSISCEKFDEIQKEQQNYAESLKEYGGDMGFHGYEVYIGNYYPNGDPLRFTEYSMKDFEKGIEKLKQFNQSLEKIKERAGSISPEIFDDFFSELRNMPIDDAQVLLDLLLKSGEKDFKQYFDLYKERNELADAISAKMYKGDAQQVATEMKAGLEEVFENVPADFFKYGVSTGESFVEGFVSQIKDFVSDLALISEMADMKIAHSEGNSQQIFSPTYYFKGDSSATSTVRLQAKNDALFNYMRGME